MFQTDSVVKIMDYLFHENPALQILPRYQLMHSTIVALARINESKRPARRGWIRFRDCTSCTLEVQEPVLSEDSGDS